MALNLHTAVRWRPWVIHASVFACLSIFFICANLKAWADDQRAFLDLSVNSINCGTVVAIVRSSDLLLETDDLRKAGLTLSAAKTETIGGRTYISLASLAPAFRYSFDKSNLSVTVTASAASFKQTDLDVALRPPAGMVFASDPAGFLNYSVTTGNFDSVSGFFESGLTLDHWLLYSGLSLVDNSTLYRGLSDVIYDDPDNMRRLTIGDAALNAPILGGGPFIGGLTLQKNFSLDPYFIQFPTQSISGSVTSPSTAYIYRNGVLIRQIQLPPGQFNLQQIPGLSGVSNTQVVLQNAFGGTQVINSPYYIGTSLLVPGLNDYQYSIGELRNNIGNSSWQYGPFAVSLDDNVGVTSWLTPGFRLEATNDLLSAGPQVTVGGWFGMTQVAVSGSRDPDQGGDGAAASFVYQYLTPKLSFSSQVQWMSPHYANLSQLPALNRPIIQENSSVNYGVGKISLGLQHIYSRERNSSNDEVTLHQILATMFFTIKRRITLSASVGQSLPGNQLPANQAYIGLNYYLGKETTASVAYDHQEAQSSFVGTLQKGLPFGPGYGYLLQAQEGGAGSSQQTAILQYQNDHAFLEGDYFHQNDQSSGTVTLAGGIIGIGGRLFLTRPVENGFALVRVAKVNDVACEWSNQLVGKTDGNGDCLFPNLLPYFGNQLGINDKDIPLNYSVGATQKTVAVAYRGGAVIRFPVHKIHQVIGTIVVANGGQVIAPANGQLVLQSQPQQVSPIGDDGEFYFEDVPVGKTKALVEYQDGTCAFDLVIPEFKEPLRKLGKLTCNQSQTGSK